MGSAIPGHTWAALRDFILCDRVGVAFRLVHFWKDSALICISRCRNGFRYVKEKELGPGPSGMSNAIAARDVRLDVRTR